MTVLPLNVQRQLDMNFSGIQKLITQLAAKNSKRLSAEQKGIDSRAKKATGQIEKRKNIGIEFRPRRLK